MIAAAISIPVSAQATLDTSPSPSSGRASAFQDALASSAQSLGGEIAPTIAAVGVANRAPLKTAVVGMKASLKPAGLSSGSQSRGTAHASNDDEASAGVVAVATFGRTAPVSDPAVITPLMVVAAVSSASSESPSVDQDALTDSSSATVNAFADNSRARVGSSENGHPALGANVSSQVAGAPAGPSAVPTASIIPLGAGSDTSLQAEMATLKTPSGEVTEDDGASLGMQSQSSISSDRPLEVSGAVGDQGVSSKEQVSEPVEAGRNSAFEISPTGGVMDVTAAVKTASAPSPLTSGDQKTGISPASGTGASADQALRDLPADTSSDGADDAASVNARNVADRSTTNLFQVPTMSLADRTVEAAFRGDGSAAARRAVAAADVTRPGPTFVSFEPGQSAPRLSDVGRAIGSPSPTSSKTAVETESATLAVEVKATDAQPSISSAVGGDTLSDGEHDWTNPTQTNLVPMNSGQSGASGTNLTGKTRLVSNETQQASPNAGTFAAKTSDKDEAVPATQTKTSQPATSSAPVIPQQSRNADPTTQKDAVPVSPVQSPAVVVPQPAPADSANDRAGAHQMLDSVPASLVSSAVDAKSSSNPQLGAQINLGIHTDAFGAVQIHTVLQQSQVGITVHSDRDLARWFSSEVPSLETGLSQSHLNLTAVEFDSGGAGIQTATGFQHGQPQQNLPQRQSGTPASADELAEDNSSPETKTSDVIATGDPCRPEGSRVSIHI